jgi:tRNA pseudouridine38-40 synthase
MVGCLKYVGENKWKPEKIKLIISSKKRKLCAPPAPACGLYLKKVIY